MRKRMSGNEVSILKTALLHGALVITLHECNSLMRAPCYQSFKGDLINQSTIRNHKWSRPFLDAPIRMHCIAQAINVQVNPMALNVDNEWLGPTSRRIQC